MQEIWKDIPGYEGLYQASNLGNIKRLKARGGKKAGNMYVRQKFGGYKDTMLTNSYGIRKTITVHRLVASAFLGFDLTTPMKDAVIMHLDNNPGNNNVLNLKIGTQSENVKQCISDYRGKQFNRKGEQHPRTKFTKKDIIYIRNQRENGVSGVKLAKKYGVSRTTICDIYKRKVWGHL